MINRSTYLDQSINRSIDQQIKRSTYQSINRSIDQSTNRSINQSTNRSINQPINWSNNQSTDQSINGPTNQSTNRSMDQSISPSTDQSTKSTSRSIVHSINISTYFILLNILFTSKNSLIIMYKDFTILDNVYVFRSSHSFVSVIERFCLFFEFDIKTFNLLISFLNRR